MGIRLADVDCRRTRLGVSSGAGGLGWFILLARNQFETPTVFAGLVTVTAIGFLMESLVFRGIEACTVRRWGMQR